MIRIPPYCILIQFIALTSSLIKLKLDKTTYKEVNITIGTAQRKFRLALDLMNQITWITPKAGDLGALIPFSATINGNIQMHFNSYLFNGYEIETSFAFNDDNQHNLFERYVFYFFTNIPNPYLYIGGHLALAFSFKDKRHSIVHQYKSKGLIDHLSFAIIDSYLYLGGIEYEDTKDRYYSSCKVNAKGDYWDCTLSSLVITTDNETYYFDDVLREDSRIVRMDILEEMYYVPPSFIHKLYMTYFANIEENKYCNFKAYKQSKQLFCYGKTYNDRGNISFKIDEYDYTFKMNELWSCDIDFCYFNFIENPNGDYWAFGNLFIQSKNVLFDYENKRIHFYSNNEIHSISQINWDKQVIVLMLFAIIIVIGIIILVVSKYSNMNKRKIILTIVRRF